MIKFFRKIRHQLLSRNSISKYLLYAIGEIVLVVIGILIALQINNWNENRKDRNKEQVILEQLSEDYHANLNQLELKIATRRRMVRSAFEVLEAIDNPNGVERDSLINYIADLTNDPTFDPIQNDLISSGNLRLISNERLNRILSNWSSDIVALKEIEDNWSKKMTEQLEPLIYQLGIGRDITNSWLNLTDHLWLLDDNTSATKARIGNSIHKISIEEILSNQYLEGIASDAISYNLTANIQSEALMRRINEIIELINNDIKED